MNTDKLKIIHVIASLRRGGAERLVLDISSQLVKLGHEITIIIFRHENEYPELSAGLNIEVIPSLVNYSLSGPDLVETLEFDKRVRSISPNIIHSHLLESEFVSRHNPIPNTLYITHWHGCHPPTNPRSFSDYFKKDTWWNINSINKLKERYETCNNQFLCISDFIRGYVKAALNVDDNLFHVILNGTNLNQFSFNEKDKDPVEYKLLAVGSFNIYKNQIFLLKVMKRLKDAGEKNIKLKLLGDGLQRRNLEDFKNQHDLSETVEFLGYVDNPNDYMNAANVLVHAAIDEPFGLILLEAMSCKLPIVAFSSGGIPEVVKDEKTGLLINVDDEQAFMEAILRLKNNPELSADFGLKGKETVQDFAIEKYVKRIENLYFDLLKRKGD